MRLKVNFVPTTSVSIIRYSELNPPLTI